MPSYYNRLDFEKNYSDSSDINGDKNVYFFTNRNNRGDDKKPNFGSRIEKGYHPSGPQFFRAGWAEVDRELQGGKIKYERGKCMLYPESAGEASNNGQLAKSEKRGSKKAFSELQNEMKEKRDVLIFLHGFNYDFDESLEDAARLADIYRKADGTSPLACVFSWPSNGRKIPFHDYHSDRGDAKASGLAMARAAQQFCAFLEEICREKHKECEVSDESLARQLCHQRIHLVAHSMGNWALENMLQNLIDLADGKRLRFMFDNAFLLAADVDADALNPKRKGKKLSLLPQIARHIHIYHNEEDVALAISDGTKSNPDRLGDNGVDTFSNLHRRITSVDCQSVTEGVLDGDVSNHHYHMQSSKVVEDISAVMYRKHLLDKIPTREVLESGRRYRII